MIVKHTQAIDYSKGGQRPELTLEREYIVHSVYFSCGQPLYIGISGREDFDPILKEISFFEIVDPRIPNNWVFSPEPNGCYDLKPIEFAGNFLQLYFDSSPEEEERARQIFRNVIVKIKRFHDRWDL